MTSRTKKRPRSKDIPTHSEPLLRKYLSPTNVLHATYVGMRLPILVPLQLPILFPQNMSKYCNYEQCSTKYELVLQLPTLVSQNMSYDDVDITISIVSDVTSFTHFEKNSNLLLRLHRVEKG